MRFLNRTFVSGLSCLFAGSLFAGTMGEKPNFEGLVLGVGGGYVNTNLTKWIDVSMFSTFPTVSQFFRNDNIRDSFAPIANVSYFWASKESDGWYWGLKGFYKYLGIQHPTLPWSGTFQDGTFQNAVFHTEAVQEGFLTLNAGCQIFDNWMVYLGIGPSLTQLETELRGNLLPSTSTLFQYSETKRSKTLFGVAGQVGFDYLMPHRVMLDFSYNLVVTPKSHIPSTYFQTGTSGFYTRFSQDINLLEQGVNITVNKYFDGVGKG